MNNFSRPNPNLRPFFESHARPFDPASDHYQAPPFDQPIHTRKIDPIYNMHAYWSKKPYDAIRQYIRHYTSPRDLVLDPFCGSGATALAALMEDRDAVAMDLSPAAVFITWNYCSPGDPDLLQSNFRALVEKVQPELDWLYATRCDRCGGQATIAYTVYSAIFGCQRCGTETALFDGVEPGSGAGEKLHLGRGCPSCHSQGAWQALLPAHPAASLNPAPVLTNYRCENGCRPARGERRHNDPDPKKRLYFERYDLAQIAEIQARSIPHWYPPHRMMNVAADSGPWGDEWRPGRNFRTVAELFTRRNLWALAAILAECGEDQPLRFCLQSALMAASRRAQHLQGGGGYIPGTYSLPPISKERNVLAVFERITQKTIRAQRAIQSQIQSADLLVSAQNAAALDEIPPASVDYIFTDPPYSGNVQFGELNFIWEAWMNFDTGWHEQEIVVNQTRRQTEQEWSERMTRAFRHLFRVLKPGRWLSLCYHDSSQGTWGLVQEMMATVGFIPDKLERAVYIDTGGRTYNQYTSGKITRRDLVINFRKPHPGETNTHRALPSTTGLPRFQEAARGILAELLNSHPGAAADRLYDELVSRTVRQGIFERHDFMALLRSAAEERPAGSGRWFNRGGAGPAVE